MTIQRLLLATGLLTLTGCSTGFFHATGTVASQGDRLHSWRSHPQGCTRDPFDGAPIGHSSSILTLLWEDPAVRVGTLSNRSVSPDAPMRLEVSHLDGSPEKPFVMLRTLDIAGMPLDEPVCRILHLTTQEHPPTRTGGLPTLSGSLALDCQTMDEHITADVTFERCSY